MRQIQIPVHPLTKRVLLAEYGCEPIAFPNQDFTFNLLSADHRRDRAPQHGLKLTASISIVVDDTTARHLSRHSVSVGLRLFRYHQQLVCRHADSANRIQGKGHIKAAIEQWLAAYKVDEDEYAVETAYKLWQRWTWKITENNRDFFGRRRGMSASISSKKMRLRAKAAKSHFPLRATLKECQVELAASRFVEGIRRCFSAPGKKCAQHARIYYYIHYGGLSCRDVAQRLGISKSTASYAVKTMTAKAQRNRTIGLLLAEAAQHDLPKAG
jgi:hypothetical protein